MLAAAGHVAVAKVELLREGEHRYTDYFPMVRHGKGWRISGYFYFDHRRGNAEPDQSDVGLVRGVVRRSYIRGFIEDGDAAAASAGVHPEALFLKHYPEFDRVATLSAGLVLPGIGPNGGWIPQGVSDTSLIDLTGSAGVARVDTRVDGRLVVTSYVMLHKPDTGWTISGILAHLWETGRAEE
jgi:hypothetical protein